MHSGIILIGLLSLISWCIQILPVISVPITGLHGQGTLYLSHFENVTFGVFGICDTVTKHCTPPKIGYSDNPVNYWNTSGVSLESMETIRLPSSAAHFVSKLLVVHVVSFVATSLLMLQCAVILGLEYLDESECNGKFMQKIHVLFKKQLDQKNGHKSSMQHTQRRDLSFCLNILLISAVSSFLLNLMAFLVDILLFVPELGVLGWIQLVPVLLMALIASLTCFIKRSILSRKHLDEELFPVSTARSRNHTTENDESGSDCGIYIYTNGFQSARLEHENHSFTSNLYGPEVLEMETLNNYHEQDSSHQHRLNE